MSLVQGLIIALKNLQKEKKKRLMMYRNASLLFSPILPKFSSIFRVLSKFLRYFFYVCDEYWFLQVDSDT